jgi:hypothetical protein
MPKYPADFYGVSAWSYVSAPIEVAYCSTSGGYFESSPRPLAVRVGFVKCEYCTTSQKRPDNGRCCACGGPTPHVDEAVYAR